MNGMLTKQWLKLLERNTTSGSSLIAKPDLFLVFIFRQIVLSPQAYALFQHVSSLGHHNSIVSDRYSAYKIPTKCYFPHAKHIRVESFKDDISNNLIEAFNNRFKAWYKTKRGFHSFHSANATISVFVFFFNFIRPHTGLNHLTPAQVAGANYNPNMKNLFSLDS